MEKANVVHIYDGYYLTLKTEKELHLHQQRQTKICYVKWNKATTKGHMPHDLTYRILKIKPIELESCFQEFWIRSDEETVVIGHKV